MANEKKPRSEAQKEAEKRYNEKREGRRSAWMMIFYPDSAPEYWKDLLSDLHLKIWVSPLHDADRWTKADEAKDPKHKAGELKKAHYHLIVKYPNPVTFNEFKKDFSCLNGVEGKYVRDLVAMVRYLPHLDDPDKAQYSVDDICLFGGANLDDIQELGKGELRAELRAMRKYIRENDITEFDLFWDHCDDCMERWSYILDEKCYGIEKYIDHRRARLKDERKQALLNKRYDAPKPEPDIEPVEGGSLSVYLELEHDKPVYDVNGNRWCKCEVCGIYAPVDQFVSYGGYGHVNRGVCRSCAEEEGDEDES